MKSPTKIRIGTSGWLYFHWQGRFYPDDLPKNKWFDYYTSRFDTVELNSTFYHLPKIKTVKNWQNNSPKNFLYAVKASRFITHIKRLNNVEEPVRNFYDVVLPLKEKLGPLLFQLPPSMKQNANLLESFLKLLPKKPKSVFEFRNQTWFNDKTYKLLEKYNAAFCIHDLQGNESPRIQTSDCIYIRFHGTNDRYSGSYSISQLQEWAGWIKEQSKKARGIYIYFNNDAHGHAIKNARQLKEMIY